VVIHPVTETLYSAWRRWRLGLSPTHPDARHMHSLWAANLQQRADESGLRIGLGTNAGASWRTQIVASVPVLLAATCPTETPLLQLICLGYVGLFVLVVRPAGAPGVHRRGLAVPVGRRPLTAVSGPCAPNRAGPRLPLTPS
jgi:hypothetical protein